jgi:hypothetical protein
VEKYGKAFAAIVFAALTTAYQITSAGGDFGAIQVVQVGIAVVTAAGVWLVPITPEAPWVKSALAALLAALQILVTAVVGGVNGSEWLQVSLAVLTALGVYLAPATSPSGSDEGEDVAVGLGADVTL